jgi:predicted MFS family arabinose efflux permease
VSGVSAPTTPGAAGAAAPAAPQARWALLCGNFVIACGVMAVPGTLNDIARSLEVSVALAGQLISVAAVLMCVGAPLLAGWVSGFDRRRLLCAALLWYALGHAACALMPNYAALLPVRAGTVLGAALFTPQAAAAVGFMARPEHRARDISFIFLGWSIASVLGMPLTAWIGQTQGWRVAFFCIAGASLLAALWVWRSLPDGVRPAAISLRAWGGVLTHPVLMAIVLVTALHAAGQFTLFSYMAPYYKQVLGANASQIGLLFLTFGACGLIGHLLLTRWIGRTGPPRAVLAALALMAVSMLLWPLAVSVATMALVIVPWGLGCFSANSAQQARLNAAAPALAAALMALNTSAMYFGQAVGAAMGGWFIAAHGFTPLSGVALSLILAAFGLSLYAERRQRHAAAT